MLLDFIEPGVNINAERYSDTLKRLPASMKDEHPGKYTSVSSSA